MGLSGAIEGSACQCFNSPVAICNFDFPPKNRSWPRLQEKDIQHRPHHQPHMLVLCYSFPGGSESTELCISVAPRPRPKRYPPKMSAMNYSEHCSVLGIIRLRIFRLISFFQRFEQGFRLFLPSWVSSYDVWVWNPIVFSSC